MDFQRIFNKIMGEASPTSNPCLNIPTEYRNAILTEEQALVVFDQLADMADIPFGYPSDGCYARAHIMCARMGEAGLHPSKAWAFEGDKKLSVTMDDGTKVRWWYHVAPVHSVADTDGVLRDMVFDPGLFDGPVTLEEWGEIMGAPSEKLEIAPLGQPPKGYEASYGPHDIGQDQNKHARVTCEQYMKWQGTEQRHVFNSQLRQKLLQSQAMPVAQTGRTWIPIQLLQEGSSGDNQNRTKPEEPKAPVPSQPTMQLT